MITYEKPSAMSAASKAAFKTKLDILANRLGVSTREKYVIDDFDRADAALNGSKSLTGEVWSVSGPGYLLAAVEKGELVGTDNYYATLNYGQAIKRVGGTFRFTEGAGNSRSSQVMTLIADSATGNLLTMLHLNFGPDSWILQKRIAGGSFDTVGLGELNLQINSVYQIAMDIDAVNGTVTVITPDGKRTTFTDPDITTINPTLATIQYSASGSGYKGNWKSIVIGKSIAEAISASGLAAPVQDVNFLFGIGITKRMRIEGKVTGAGWYRIANKVTLKTFVMVGNIQLTATDVARATVCSVDVKTNTGGGAPELVERQCLRVSGGPITNIRLSRDDAAFTIGLDVYIPNANEVSFWVDFTGYFAPVQSPVIGATEEVTAATTLVLS